MNESRAFSLWEVLCVLLIMSVFASQTMSGILSYYRLWSERQTIYSSTKSLIKAIESARSLAVKLDTPITLCGMQCNGDWSGAVSIWRSNENHALRYWELPDYISIVWRGFPSNKSNITFLSTGMSEFQNGSFYVCYNGIKQRRIVLNKAGRTYMDSSFMEGDVC